MKLLEAYSLGIGLKINKPFIYQAFYPLPFQKYITLHASAGMPAKEYSYWEDVVDLITPTLAKEGIRIVQIGGPNDAPIRGTFSLQGRTTVNQTAYVIANSILHVSNDSFSAHLAGAENIPLVTIFGSTTVENHSPYFFNKESSTFIEADRKGFKASYAREESPKMVDTIKPEQIANEILRRFGEKTSRETVLLGKHYPVHIIEVIPDHALPANAFPGGIVNVRMDYHFDEQNLARMLYTRKCNVITDKPIDIRILRQLKQNINNLSVDVFEDTDPNYIRQLKALGVKLDLYSSEKDTEKLNNLRLKYFEFEISEDSGVAKEVLDISKKIRYNSKYKTNKFLVSKDGIFLSKVDWKLGKAVKSFAENVGDVNDTLDFWEEADYFYIFNT